MPARALRQDYQSTYMYGIGANHELDSPYTSVTCDGAGPDKTGSLIHACGGSGCVFDRNTSNVAYCRTLGGTLGGADGAGGSATYVSDKAFVCQLDAVSKASEACALFNCSLILCYEHRPRQKLTLLTAILAFVGLGAR